MRHVTSRLRRSLPLLALLLLAGCRHTLAGYHYEVLLPRGYTPQRAWPLVLYLHGDGGTGDLQVLRTLLADRGGRLRLPFLLVVPLWPGPARDWDLDAVTRIVDEICRRYAVDRHRVNVAGFSRGGDGAWALGERFGPRLASLVPVSGEGDPKLACRMRDVAVWAWHGLDDHIVDPQRTRDLTQALAACGGRQPLVSLLPGYGHDTVLWRRVFAGGAVYQWMLDQRSVEPWSSALAPPAPAAIPAGH